MGFFGLFKKKDDFDGMLKDPLTDPLGSMPGSMGTGMPDSNFPRNDLPNFDNSGMNLKNENMVDEFSQAQMGSNNGFGTTASPVSTNNSPYATSPPLFRGQNSGQIRKAEPEVYEEMNVQSKQNNPKIDTYSLDKRDVELLNSKLDTIKTQLENLNHRLDNIERGANDAQTQRRRYAW